MDDLVIHIRSIKNINKKLLRTDYAYFVYLIKHKEVKLDIKRRS